MPETQLKLEWSQDPKANMQETLKEVNREIDDVFDPYFASVAGSRLVPFEKTVLRTYLMNKLLGKFGETDGTIPS